MKKRDSLSQSIPHRIPFDPLPKLVIALPCPCILPDPPGFRCQIDPCLSGIDQLDGNVEVPFGDADARGIVRVVVSSSGLYSVEDIRIGGDNAE